MNKLGLLESVNLWKTCSKLHIRLLLWPKLPTYFDGVTTIENNRQVRVNVGVTLVAIFRIHFQWTPKKRHPTIWVIYSVWVMDLYQLSNAKHCLIMVEKWCIDNHDNAVTGRIQIGWCNKPTKVHDNGQKVVRTIIEWWSIAVTFSKLINLLTT